MNRWASRHPEAMAEIAQLPLSAQPEALRARVSDPATSWAASQSVRDLTSKQQAVLSVFQLYSRGMTDVTLSQRYEMEGLAWQSDSGLRTRRKELVEQGLLRDTGERERLPSGREAIVWGLT